MARQRIGAAIDIGSNSVHLLVASLVAGGLRELRDESELLGLGDVVDRDGELPPATQVELAAAVARYVALARELGAEVVSIVATEPLRRARNGHEVAEAVGTAVGLPVNVLSDTLEGELTYLGVTSAATSAQTQLVVDIGGGSSEVIVAEPGRHPQVTSLPTGSSRLSSGIVHHDPPTVDELDALLSAARRHVDVLARAEPAGAVFVGGTATNLARIAPLTREGLALAYRNFVRLSSLQLVERYGVNHRRARQLPAGAALVDALLAHFRIEEAAVSQASLRDGAIIAADLLGAGWPERLSDYLASVQAAAPPGSRGE